MVVKIITDVDSEPVALEDAKLWAKISGASEDDIMEDIILPSARKAVEDYCSCSMAEKEYEVIFEKSESYYELPYGPVIEVSKVEILYSRGDNTELPEDDYYVVGDKLYAGEFLSTRHVVGMKVTYTAGYGDDTEPLPAPLKEAVLRQFVTQYDYRENTGGAGISPQAREICAPYRRRVWL